MCIRQRLNTSANRGFDLFGSITRRQSHGSLHNCQKVFCSMINLATEKGNKFFLSFTIRNIARNFRRAESILPCSSLIGDTVRETSIKLPSFRIRTVS